MQGVYLSLLGAFALYLALGSAACGEDNCGRALRGSSVAASLFCATYTTDTAIAVPTYLGNCDGSSSKILSACSCVFTPTCAAGTSTVTVTVSGPASTITVSVTGPGSVTTDTVSLPGSIITDTVSLPGSVTTDTVSVSVPGGVSTDTVTSTTTDTTTTTTTTTVSITAPPTGPSCTANPFPVYTPFTAVYANPNFGLYGPASCTFVAAAGIVPVTTATLAQVNVGDGSYPSCAEWCLTISSCYLVGFNEVTNECYQLGMDFTFGTYEAEGFNPDWAVMAMVFNGC